ncbi:methyl farnesoate epoxidase isoform X2 [Anabrus simplex]|uniref:methyl farnesoate epoxidase isoform X2 n=1 Tax=Anabrus simplex TaxID=316456 RepID=UPI0035A3CE3B
MIFVIIVGLLVISLLIAFDISKPRGYPPGVVFVDGPLWVEQRRFSLRHLRNFGYGKHGMEHQIAEEASELVASLRQQCNNDSAIIPMHQAFDICVLNSLWTMLAGQRFALDDEQLKKLLNLVHASFRMLDMSGGLLNQMPFLSVIAPHQSGYADLVKYLHEMWDFLRETIHEHHRTLTPGVSRDLIDAFLHEMELHPDSTFTENQLITVCLDLFMAGSETTSNTMEYAILYMLLYPEVQRKIHEELDAVVGRSRLPMFADRQRLCYVEAVIMEVQRRVSVAPVAVPHRATKDTMLMGHVIPQDTTVLISIWSLHMDVKHWGDPEAFRPERFLDAEGKIMQDDWFVPFGYGRRRCLGEILARKSLFLFFATLLHTFSLSVPADHPPPSPDGYDGITLSPKHFYAEFTPRF